mgnify:CR=1 FL=1|tara:strand:- start:2940 stop:3518 length:579 start_codon:yes stop_codon:yes gene_type:complete
MIQNYEQDILYKSLLNFYKINNNSILLINYLKKDKVSLRIIDWFVTNYSKKNDTIYNIYSNSEGGDTLNEDNNYVSDTINVFHSYKSQLKSYSKKNFDPFCRRDRLPYVYNESGDIINTTIGQLNFFRWAIKYKLIDYIKNSLNDIEEDMNNSLNLLKKNNKSSERKKRQELSKSASRGLNKHHGKIVITFD